VWIVYEEQLDAWEAHQRRRSSAEHAPKQI
jgi:hypothetical protein